MLGLNKQNIHIFTKYFVSEKISYFKLRAEINGGGGIMAPSAKYSPVFTCTSAYQTVHLEHLRDLYVTSKLQVTWGKIKKVFIFG